MRKEDAANMERFDGKMKELLKAELEAGNEVVETWHGNWPVEGTVAVLLKYPFKCGIRRDIAGIEYREVNDPHYWQAEYYEEATGFFLMCKFG